MADGRQFGGYEHSQRGTRKVSGRFSQALDQRLGIELGSQRPEADNKRLETVALGFQTSNRELGQLQLRRRVSWQGHVASLKRREDPVRADP